LQTATSFALRRSKSLATDQRSVSNSQYDSDYSNDTSTTVREPTMTRRNIWLKCFNL
uniref:Uncharacterized protein n=1 Tax=Heligmosomoides polygyrus TaxID=6339 RepID=A0A183GUS3_HELPZ